MGGLDLKPKFWNACIFYKQEFEKFQNVKFAFSSSWRRAHNQQNNPDNGGLKSTHLYHVPIHFKRKSETCNHHEFYYTYSNFACILSFNGVWAISLRARAQSPGRNGEKLPNKSLTLWFQNSSCRLGGSTCSVTDCDWRQGRASRVYCVCLWSEWIKCSPDSMKNYLWGIPLSFYDLLSMFFVNRLCQYSLPYFKIRVTKVDQTKCQA